jgi:hypothetical protein
VIPLFPWTPTDGPQCVQFRQFGRFSSADDAGNPVGLSVGL